MEYLQITIEAFKFHLASHVVVYGPTTLLPHESHDAYHYHHACAYASLLQKFGMTEAEVEAIAAEVRAASKKSA